MKNRKEIIEERLLRDNIRKIIKKNLSKLEEKHFLQEQNLRNSIRNIILEKVLKLMRLINRGAASYFME